MSRSRKYPPPPGLDRPGGSLRLPPPPSLRSDSGRSLGSRAGRGGRGRGGRGRSRGGYDSRENDRPNYGNSNDNGRDRDSFHPLPARPPSPRNGTPPPRGEFTFRAPKPAGVHEAQQTDSYVPRDRDRDRDWERDRDRDRGRDRDWDRRSAPSGPRPRSSYQPNRLGNDRRGDRRDNRRGRGGRFGTRFIAADRPILHQSTQSNGDASQDFAQGAGGITYLNLDELSDSDEAEMDISDEEGGDGKSDGRPARKRTRLAQADDGASVPKWSNPDPYTVLPPTETGQKKKDVVHLIRKARVAAENAAANAPADTEEFISCDMDSETGDDDDGDDGDDMVVIDDVDDYASSKDKGGDSNGKEPPAATAQAVSNGTSSSNANPTTDSAAIAAAAAAAADHDRSTSDATEPSKPLSNRAAREATRQAKAAAKKDKNKGTAALADIDLNPPRKRTRDDQFKLPDHAKLKRATMQPAAGIIVVAWRVRSGEDSCPWLRDHADTAVMATWLHKEIIDFYDHVKPRSFEQRLRQDLIDDLDRVVHTRFSNSKIFCFGSFMSGLYLPTGDMDLVMCSKTFLNNRPPVFNKKGVLFKFGNFLCTNRMADREHLEHITRAKVPLVKYVDMKTWLKVDVSFENMTGVAAVRTFTQWRDQYPAMPILVTLIKQFLMMRGLNEPVNGGIGGFSMICLVVSMLQLMPPIQSQDMNSEHHLGDLLMHFFDLYGNKFNYETTAICLNPPGYVPKSRVTNIVYKSVDRLSIIDPNNPQNDISGGSRNTPAIMRAFSDAHEALRQRMLDIAEMPEPKRHNQSLLRVILEGDYSSYREQREHLRSLYQSIYGTPSD